MGAYREDRRTDPIPPVRRYGSTEPAADSDVHRREAYERARERLADETRSERSSGRKRFANLVKTGKRNP